MNKDLRFRKEVLFEALKITIASISIQLENGCTNSERLKLYAKYYEAICLKAFMEFHNINKEYTKKEMAIKKYTLLFSETTRENLNFSDDLLKYLDSDSYNNIHLYPDEKFILISIINLSTFINGNNPNKIRHLLNTYIPKVIKCIKNSSNYLNYFRKDLSFTEIKTILFKFLVENS